MLNIYDEEFRPRERAEAVRHAEQLEQCIAKHGHTVPRHARWLWPRIGRDMAYDFPYLNPWSRLHLARALLRDVANIWFMQVPIFELTIIDWHFDTTDKTWNFDLEEMRQMIETALDGCSYVGMIEFAYFMNYRPSPYQGRLICPHFQGIIWGEDTRERINETRQSFAGGRFGATGVRLSPIGDARDFITVVSYSIKAPNYGYRLSPHLVRPFDNSSRMYLPQHLFMLRKLGDYTYWDMMIAGGQCTKIVRSTRRRLTRQRDTRRERLADIGIANG